MAKKKSLVCLLVCYGCIAATCTAEISWDKSEAELKADAGQTSVILGFKFKNTGLKPARIISVSSSCGCIVSEFPTRAIAPGEAGELMVKMSLDGRVGRISGIINVTSDSLVTMTQTLKLLVDVPEPVKIAPRRLEWKRNSSEGEKVVAVTLSDPSRARLDTVVCSNPQFTATVTPADKPGLYHISIRARDTTRPSKAFLRVRTIVNEVSQESLVYATVQ